jgi:hypothetical protein
MHNVSELVYALEEEIGDLQVFTGRKSELNYLLNWSEGVKSKHNKSLAFLARRKKGKTALMQRFYNILFTKNDPMLIPFYYRIREREMSELELGDDFYNSLLNQYAAFKTRNPSLIKKKNNYDELQRIFSHDEEIVKDIAYMKDFLAEENGHKAWSHAAYAGERISIMKNERIIQILDEFQYLNKYMYKLDQGVRIHLHLCGTYHHVGSSKISPVIVTGSGDRLEACPQMDIVLKMTGRYRSIWLKNLPIEEGIEAVYNYARHLKIPITEEVAAYIATVTDGDAFYISSILNSDYPKKDLTDANCIDDIIMHETRTKEGETGEIAGMWLEYLEAAIDKINDKNGKRIILYLAKYGHEDRTRKEIMDDLQLNMTDGELEKKLDAFIKADILSYGQSRFRYRGLGDKFFDMVFRSMYQEEIDSLETDEIEQKLRAELASARGGLSFYKGAMTEYMVINKLAFAVMDKIPLKKLLFHHIEDYELSEFCSEVGKARFYKNQLESYEVDIYIQSKDSAGDDFVIEVKNHTNQVKKVEVEKFIALKKELQPKLKARTGFIFYSQKPLSKKLAGLLKDEGIMLMYGE